MLTNYQLKKYMDALTNMMDSTCTLAADVTTSPS